MEIWQMVLFRLMSSFWTQTFEDCEKTMVGLNIIMLETLYVWVLAQDNFAFFNYFNLASLFSFSLLVECFILYTSYYVPGLEPSVILITLSYKKKKHPRGEHSHKNTNHIHFKVKTGMIMMK